MTTSDSRSLASQEAEGTPRGRGLFLMAGFVQVGVIPSLAFYVYIALQTRAWQAYAELGLGLALLVLAVVSSVLIRRGQLNWGTWLLVDAIAAIAPIGMVFVAGMGAALGLLVPLVIVVIAAQGLPREQVRWAMIAGAASGIASLLIDLFGPADRLRIPGIQILIPIVAGAVVLTLGFFAIRRFASHLASLRVLLVGSLVIILVLLMLATALNYVFTSRLGQAVTALEEETARANATLAVGRRATELLLAMERGLVSRSEVYLAQAVGEAQLALVEALEDLSGCTKDLPEDDPLQTELYRLRDGSSHVLDMAEQSLAIAEGGTWEEVEDPWWAHRLSGYSRDLDRAVESLAVQTAERREASVAEAEATRRLMQRFPVTVGLLVVAVSALTVLIAIRIVARPVGRLTEAAARLAAGHLEERVPVERVEEFGRMAVAFNEMADELQALYTQLEQRVADRTRDLERRTVQLEAAIEVARETAVLRDIGQLLVRIVHLVSERFGFYHAGIFLIDEVGEYAVLRAASSEGGRRMLDHGHRLRVGEVGIVGYVAASGESRIALDVGEDAVFFDNPDLPLTRSEMALPLRVRERMIGVLDVQSTEAEAFAGEDVAVLQALADQVALAIENARLLEESQRAVRELQDLYGRRAREAWQERAARQPAAYLYTRVGVEPASPSTAEWVDASGAWYVRATVLQEGDGYRLVAPIRLRGQPIGSVVLRRDLAEEPWTPEEIALAEEVSTQIALALENARLLEETRQRAEQERIIADITARVRSSMDPETILQIAVQELGAALGTDRAFVQLGVGAQADEE